MKFRNCTIVSAIAAGIALAVPGSLNAQICAGYPSTTGILAVGGNFASVPGGSSFGIEASYDYTSPFGSFARFNLVRPDDDTDNTSIFGAGVSYEITDFVPIIPSWLSTCPLAAVSVSTEGGDTRMRLPVGVGFAAPVPLAPGFDIVPFAIPQFILTRVSVNDITVSDNNFGIGFGALARFSSFYVGVNGEKDFVDGSDVDVSFRAGVGFGIQ